MSNRNQAKKEYFKNLFSDIDLETIGKMSDEDRRKFILQHADQILASGEDFARSFENNILDLDGKSVDDATFRDVADSEDKWLYDIARILAGTLGDGINLMLEALGLPLFDTDPCEVFDIGCKELRMQLSGLGYPSLSAYAMKTLTGRALDWGTCNNPVVMDNISESIDYLMTDLDSEEGCRKLTEKCMEVLDDTEAHLRQGKALGLDYHTQFIIDSLWGFVPHPYPENYVNCAKAIYDKVSDISIPQSAIDDPEGEYADQFSQKVVKVVKELVGKYEVEFDDHSKNLSLSYMKYWGIHYFEIKTGRRTINGNWNDRL